MTIDLMLELIKTVMSIATAVGVGFAARGFYLQKRIWQDYHQRARYDKAVALFSDLTKSMNANTRAAIRLVEEFGAVEIKSMHAGESFELPAGQEQLLLTALPEGISKDLSRTGDKRFIKVSGVQALGLRWQIIGFLNHLEFICQAWKNDVGDAHTIEAELAGLYNPENGQTFCANYRDRFNGRTKYPALSDFLSKLRPTNPTTQTIGGRPVQDEPKKLND